MNHLEIIENNGRQEVRDGRICNIIDARLTHKPDYCKHCGVLAEGNIIQNGTFKTYPRLT